MTEFRNSEIPKSGFGFTNIDCHCVAKVFNEKRLIYILFIKFYVKGFPKTLKTKLANVYLALKTLLRLLKIFKRRH